MAVTGRHRFIADYLSEDVLAPLPEDLQQFMLQTSILDRLCGSLCDTVTGRDDGQMTLETIERANLFLVALDPRREWFRYHSLFADYLREKLQRRHPQQVADLHCRAARWFLDHDLPEQAVRHAVDGDDVELVSQILERYMIAKLLGGEITMVQRWLDALPHTWYLRDAMIGFTQAGVMLVTGQFDACAQVLDDIEQRTPATQKEANHQYARVAAMRCNIACFRNDLMQAEGFADRALRLAGLRPGMRFLDVAAGSGALSIPAARLGAQVLSVDFAPVMVERLNTRARDEGLSGLEAYVTDGHALDLEDSTFDIAGSQNGVSLFPNLPQGLREMVRVTKPGGRVLIVAFSSLRKAEFLGFFLSAIQAAAPGFTGPSMDPPPLPFQVANPEKLRQQMANAGLTNVRVKTTAWRMEFQSGTEMWDVVTNSNPIGSMLVADLTDEHRTAAQQALDDMLRERSGGTGRAVLTNEMNVAIGTK